MQAFAYEPLAAPVPADDLVDRAAADAAALAHAREQARAEGFAAGRAEALAALAPASAAFAAAVAAAQEEAARVAEGLEAEAVELALAIAEKVVAGTLLAEPERVLEAVRGALRGIVDRSRVTVLVHPDDLELVRDAAPEIATTLGGVETLEVQAERRVNPGGAVVRHAEGEVDAQIAVKLERVRELAAGA
jgi:flagellar assembly protein FliH